MMLHKVRLSGAILVLSAACAIPRAHARTTRYEAPLPVRFAVLNAASAPVAFEFRIDGVQMIDTTVSIGAEPPVVLFRHFRLTPGRHRFELFDRRHDEYHTLEFDVQPTVMSVEVWFGPEHAKLRAFYGILLYM
jgi:hypothetical protein